MFLDADSKDESGEVRLLKHAVNDAISHRRSSLADVALPGPKETAPTAPLKAA